MGIFIRLLILSVLWISVQAYTTPNTKTTQKPRATTEYVPKYTKSHVTSTRKPKPTTVKYRKHTITTEKPFYGHKPRRTTPEPDYYEYTTRKSKPRTTTRKHSYRITTKKPIYVHKPRHTTPEPDDYDYYTTRKSKPKTTTKKPTHRITPKMPIYGHKPIYTTPEPDYYDDYTTRKSKPKTTKKPSYHITSKKPIYGHKPYDPTEEPDYYYYATTQEAAVCHSSEAFDGASKCDLDFDSYGGSELTSLSYCCALNEASDCMRRSFLRSGCIGMWYDSYTSYHISLMEDHGDCTSMNVDQCSTTGQEDKSREWPRQPDAATSAGTSLLVVAVAILTAIRNSR